MKKADRFMKPGTGKRKASIDIKEEVLISRQRFSRIFEGQNFEITATEAKTIAALFNISTDYFKKDGEKCYSYIALPGESEHQTGLAVDFGFMDPETGLPSENAVDSHSTDVADSILEHPEYPVFPVPLVGLCNCDTHPKSHLVF